MSQPSPRKALKQRQRRRKIQRTKHLMRNQGMVMIPDSKAQKLEKQGQKVIRKKVKKANNLRPSPKSSSESARTAETGRSC